jgi:hypothetical protein
MAKASEWLRGRRAVCEGAFSFLMEDFGYRRSLRRFQSGPHGFQIGYLGPGAGVLVEWNQRDGMMVWLLPLSPGEVPVNWGGPGGPRGFDLGFFVLLADEEPQVSGSDMHSPTDDDIAALAGQLRSRGQDMLRGDYSVVPAIQDLITARAERLRNQWRRTRGITG